MKIFLNILLMVLFTLNTSFLNAVAQNCDHDMASAIQMTKVEDRASMPDCHIEKNTKVVKKHCSGACKCVHSALVFFTFKAAQNETTAFPLMKEFYTDNNRLHGILGQPLIQPPRA